MKGDLFSLDGFDDCVIGLLVGDGKPDAICYDLNKVIDKLRESMELVDALEYFYANIFQACPRDGAPVFVKTTSMEVIQQYLKPLYLSQN